MKRSKKQEEEFNEEESVIDDQEDSSGSEENGKSSNNKKKLTSENKKKTKLSQNEDDEDDVKEGSMKAEIDKDGNKFFQLGGKKRLTISKYKGSVYVNIREYWNNGKEDLPGKKGIALNLEAWKVIKSNIKVIDEAIKNA